MNKAVIRFSSNQQAIDTFYMIELLFILRKLSYQTYP